MNRYGMPGLAALLWLLVMLLASVIFAVKWRALRKRGVDLEARFQALPRQ